MGYFDYGVIWLIKMTMENNLLKRKNFWISMENKEVVEVFQEIIN